MIEVDFKKTVEVQADAVKRLIDRGYEQTAAALIVLSSTIAAKATEVMLKK